MSAAGHAGSWAVAGVPLTARVIEGAFPNSRQLVPASCPTRLVVERELVLNALRRVRLLARDATTPVRLTMRPDVVELTVVTSEVGQAMEDVDAKYEGAELTVAFNPSYLVDGIEAAGGEEVAIDTIDALRPAIVRDTGSEEYLYLLMPVRVS